MKEALISAVVRFKRADNFLSYRFRLQLSELAVMGRAAGGCDLAEKGMCVSEIHETLHISKPAVSQTLNSLERKGYILRAIDPADRRKITVTVTAKGRAELEECTRCFDQMMDDVLETFGAENAAMLIEQIHRLMDILDALQCEQDSVVEKDKK